MVSHLNKGGGTSEALSRVTGSLAFVAAARGAFIVAKDKDDPLRRLLLPAKNNIATDVGGLAFSVQSFALPSGIGTSRVLWEAQPVTITADEAMVPAPEGGEQTEDAVDLLREMLVGGRILARDIKRRAGDAGISDKALRSARQKLGIGVSREGFGADTRTYWSLHSCPPDPFVPSSAYKETRAEAGAGGTNGAAPVACGGLLIGALLKQFAAAGVRFERGDGGNLRALGTLTDQLRTAIRTHKPAILAELAANDTGTASPGQRQELRELIAIIFAGDTEAERAETLAVACADPEAALTSFRALVADLQDPLEPCMSDDKAKDPATLVLLGQEGQTDAEVRAAATIGPAVQAAYTVAKIEKGGDLNALVAALHIQSKRAVSGDTGRMEEMLITQAHTLDLIFNNLTRRAVANMQDGYVQIAETYLRLALKAQSQSRASIESLAQIKNPPVVYARQANFANGPQQVNNGTQARVRENEILQSEPTAT